MVVKQLADGLESEGIKPIEAVGQAFDPNVHEAIAFQPTQGVPAHHVVAEMQRGYTLNDRLLRAATVLVSAPIPDEETSDAVDAGGEQS